MQRITHTAIVFTFVAGAVVAGGIPLHADFSQYWSSIGAVGIADESSTSLITRADTGAIFIKSGIASATAQLRYAVYPFGDMQKDLSRTGDRWCVGMAYRDTGATARVVATFKSVNFFMGEIVTHGVLDSDTLAPTGTAYDFVWNCTLVNKDRTPMTSFFSGGAAYYIDVKLIKTASDGNPGLKVLQFLNSLST